jgi:hypothetical protein
MDDSGKEEEPRCQSMVIGQVERSRCSWAEALLQVNDEKIQALTESKESELEAGGKQLISLDDAISISAQETCGAMATVSSGNDPFAQLLILFSQDDADGDHAAAFSDNKDDETCLVGTTAFDVTYMMHMSTLKSSVAENTGVVDDAPAARGGVGTGTRIEAEEAEVIAVAAQDCNIPVDEATCEQARRDDDEDRPAIDLQRLSLSEKPLDKAQASSNIASMSGGGDAFFSNVSGEATDAAAHDAPLAQREESHQSTDACAAQEIKVPSHDCGTTCANATQAVDGESRQAGFELQSAAATSGHAGMHDHKSAVQGVTGHGEELLATCDAVLLTGTIDGLPVAEMHCGLEGDAASQKAAAARDDSPHEAVHDDAHGNQEHHVMSDASSLPATSSSSSERSQQAPQQPPALHHAEEKNAGTESIAPRQHTEVRHSAHDEDVKCMAREEDMEAVIAGAGQKSVIVDALTHGDHQGSREAHDKASSSCSDSSDSQPGRQSIVNTAETDGQESTSIVSETENTSSKVLSAHELSASRAEAESEKSFIVPVCVIDQQAAMSESRAVAVAVAVAVERDAAADGESRVQDPHAHSDDDDDDDSHEQSRERPRAVAADMLCDNLSEEVGLDACDENMEVKDEDRECDQQQHVAIARQAPGSQAGDDGMPVQRRVVEMQSSDVCMSHGSLALHQGEGVMQGGDDTCEQGQRHDDVIASDHECMMQDESSGYMHQGGSSRAAEDMGARGSHTRPQLCASSALYDATVRVVCESESESVSVDMRQGTHDEPQLHSQCGVHKASHSEMPSAPLKNTADSDSDTDVCIHMVEHNQVADSPNVNVCNHPPHIEDSVTHCVQDDFPPQMEGVVHGVQDDDARSKWEACMWSHSQTLGVVGSAEGQVVDLQSDWQGDQCMDQVRDANDDTNTEADEERWEDIPIRMIDPGPVTRVRSSGDSCEGSARGGSMRQRRLSLLLRSCCLMESDGTVQVSVRVVCVCACVCA